MITNKNANPSEVINPFVNIIGFEKRQLFYC